MSKMRKWKMQQIEKCEKSFVNDDKRNNARKNTCGNKPPEQTIYKKHVLFSHLLYFIGLYRIYTFLFSMSPLLHCGST